MEFNYFEVAFSHYMQGNRTVLVDLLRTDYPMTAQIRNTLADIIEGKFKRRPGRPAARAFQLRDHLEGCAAQVEWMKQEFREKHRRRNAPHRLIVAEVAQMHGVDFDALDMRCRQSKQRHAKAAKKRKFSSS